MSENILNISKWKDEYPFLGNVWTTYNDFDNDVDDYKSGYYSLCYYILKDNHEELIKYSDFCMKILRNLGYLSVVPKIYGPTSERCNMLYNWIYNSIDEKKITENIVDKCFKMYAEEMYAKGHVPNCSKLSYENDFKLPKKMTLLHIFEFNMQIIIDFLNEKRDLDKIPWRKFICECVKIYKQMNDAYCHNEEGKIEDYRKTCLKLKQFKGVYKIFRSKLGSLNTSIPSMDDLNNEYSVKCSEEGQNHVLKSERATDPDDTSRMGISTDSKDRDNTFIDDLPPPPESADNSMKNITTTIGTLAGASSVLALLYRFTPAGRLVNPRLKRNVGRTNNNFYSNGESELLFYEFSPGDINTYNIGYEAA